MCIRLASHTRPATRSLARTQPLNWHAKRSLGLAPNHKHSSQRLSLVEGASIPALSPLSLPQFFYQEILPGHEHKPALVFRSEPTDAHGVTKSRDQSGTHRHLSWNYAELDEHIKALSRGMIAMGIRPGDRVGVLMGNCSAYALLQWACAAVGAILVTINPAYRTNELIGALSLTTVSHLFIVPHLRSSFYLQMLESSIPSLSSAQAGSIQVEELKALRNVVVFDDRPWLDDRVSSSIQSKHPWTTDWRDIFVWNNETGYEGKEMQRRVENGVSSDVSCLQFTSGTTGLPKAVSLTHSNLLNNAISIADAMKLTSNDVVCNVPPLFHCFGLVLGALSAATARACTVYPSPVFDPRKIVDSVSEERCTALHGVPTHFLGVLDEIERRRDDGESVDTHRLRTGIAAGSPVPIELMRRLIDETGLTELTNAYGMTETSPVSFQTITSDPLLARVETVGRVRPHVRAKIVDTQGNVVPRGKEGQVCVSGYLVQKGYWEDPEQSATVMKEDEDGTMWMYTGDEGIMDEEGYLRIVGRIKDIIIRGGENLFPVQIENALLSNALIHEAAVVSVPDKKYGETVGAWVVRKSSSDAKNMTRADIRKDVAQRMNPQNAPSWIWFVGEEESIDELPKTASGKVQKHILRQRSRELAKEGKGKVQ